MEKRGINPNQRIERLGGGQFVKNLLFEFAAEIEDQTIMKCKKQLSELSKTTMNENQDQTN